MDELQLLVESNHNVNLYPGWSNTADFCTTTERFGTVPLHSPALGEAMSFITLPPNVTSKFKADQQNFFGVLPHFWELRELFGSIESPDTGVGTKKVAKKYLLPTFLAHFLRRDGFLVLFLGLLLGREEARARPSGSFQAPPG